jgi:hypothetical protein
LVSNFEKYGLIAASSLSLRNQYDGFKKGPNGKYKSKERLVNDYDFAISGGKNGSRFATSKDVYINGLIYPGKACTRTRIVNALPSAYNNIGSSVFEGLRSAAEKKYHMTWKHRGKEHVKSKIDGYPYVIGLDVTQYDNSFPEWLYEEWLNELPLTEDFKAFCRLGMKAPSFYSANGDKPEPVWTGDPLDIEYYNQYTGLPSGIFYTSMLGKDGFTWAVLCMLDDINSDVLGNVDAILRHEHPKYAISNMGDDTIVHSSSQNLIDSLRTRAEHNAFGMSEYFKVDIEDGFRFLGMVGYKDEEGEVHLVGDLATYFGNMLVPERSIGSKMRQYGVYGLVERREVYRDNPSFEKADEIFQETFREVFGISWMELLEQNMVLPQDSNIYVRNPADLEVLLDPSKLFYKYDSSEISEEILEIIQTNVPKGVQDQFIDLGLDKTKVQPYVKEL